MKYKQSVEPLVLFCSNPEKYSSTGKENRDLIHLLCNCIDVLLLRQTQSNNIYSNLHVSKDLHEVTIV